MITACLIILAWTIPQLPLWASITVTCIAGVRLFLRLSLAMAKLVGGGSEKYDG